VNTDELRVLARRADDVEGRPETRLEEVHARIQRTRRHRAVGAGTATLAVLLTLGIAATLVGGDGSRSHQPVEPAPTPSEKQQVPTGQRTVAPRVAPEDLRGWTVLATRTTRQPENRGASELVATVTVHSDSTYYSSYCHSDDPSVWFFIERTDGGAAWGPCDEGVATLAPPDLAETPDLWMPTPTWLRMIVSRPSVAERACYLRGTEDCRVRFGRPQPTGGTGADFGFRLFDPPPDRPTFTLFRGPGLQHEVLMALSTIGGTPWLVDRAVVSAPDARRLTVELGPAAPARLVDVYSSPVRPERCARRHARDVPDPAVTDTRVFEAAWNRVCGVGLRLVVDGSVVPATSEPSEAGHFRELGALLAPGEPHTVEVTVVRGDPHTVRLAVVLRDRTTMP
jgi:hypothetical protein